jgi:hypothetical protein
MIWTHKPNTYAYGLSTSNSTILTATIFNINQSSMTAGQRYYYKAYANDSKGNMTMGNLRYTLTNPGIPIFMNIIPSFLNSSVKITWLKGAGANRTLIVKNYDHYPTSLTDGIIVYNGTGTSAWNHSIAFNVSNYFSLFSYTAWGVLSRLSGPIHVPWGGISFIIRNESRPWQVIRGNLLVSDSLGLYPVNFTNVYGYYAFNISRIPYGVNTLFYVSNSSYHSRLYPIDILPNIFYNFTFYLPPLHHNESGPPGGNITGSYLIQVINDYQFPVKDALVRFYRYFNTTANYTYIGGFVSDGNGQGSIDLFPFQLYMIKIICDGYQNDTEFWTPNIAEQSMTKIFKIYLSTIPEPSIFYHVIYSIEPTQSTQTGAFTAYFNITNIDAKLIWFTASMAWFNTSTSLLETFFSENITTTVGGSIACFVPNITGVYRFTCSFGKNGFSNYTIQRFYNVVNETNPGNNLDELITKIAGHSPVYIHTPSGDVVVAWTALIASFISIFVLFTLSPRFSGLAIMATGGVLGLFKQPLGFLPDNILSWTAIAAIIVIGLILTIETNKET